MAPVRRQVETMDASNLLKPAFGIRCPEVHGATTYEFRGVFEKDHALSRRFQKSM